MKFKGYGTSAAHCESATASVETLEEEEEEDMFRGLEIFVPLLKIVFFFVPFLGRQFFPFPFSLFSLSLFSLFSSSLY